VLLVCALLSSALAGAQIINPSPTGDVLGVHDLSAGNSPMRGSNANACIYCHAPHNALSTTPLWNQTLSTKQYTVYPGSTPTPGTPITVGKASTLCLSCHDGSVAVGQTVAIGALKMQGVLTDNLGTKLEGSHPFSIQPQIKDGASLVSTLAASHQTKDPAVKLIDNNIECSTCHDVHNQYRDRRSPEFLVRDNTSGALCFACHDTGARTVNGHTNTLTAWPNSAHAKSTVAITAKAAMGGYSNVGEFACSICHASHDALGAALIRKNPTRPANVDDTSQACFRCHNGSDSLAQPIANVLADITSPGQYAHPFGDGNNTHTLDEPVILDRNRHATCADCHSAHAAQPTTAFLGTSDIRPSQTGVSGVAVDGTVIQAAVNQYENCLRCHSTSEGKQSLPSYGYMPARALFPGDTLNVALQFAPGAGSSHPVMRDATNLSRPSLLAAMWNIGFTLKGRAMSKRLLCTDCHNSDNNREFGGTGPNGTHGSKNEHILERQYVISKIGSGGPGSPIINLNSPPVLDPVSNSPYALCAKCHDLKYIASGASWAGHTQHIQDGFSCSVCHSAHGVPAGTSGVNGGRALVSFDMNVVASNSGQPVSYNGSTCTLVCHGKAH
jgi:predicted CXXCH cytochrome family protein